MNTSLPALLLSCLVLSACGSGDGDRDSTASGTTSETQVDISQATAEAAELLGPQGDQQRALWEDESGEWSVLVLNAIHERREVFEAARDLEYFCPGYTRATSYQKDTCWLRLVSGMARYESNFVPSATYREKNGAISVGLLMMNPEHCEEADTVELLKNPASNIKCAMGRMALLVARDRNVSGSGKEKGAAAYWSVLRAPYRFEKLFLGRRPHIREFTVSYAAFAET